MMNSKPIRRFLVAGCLLLVAAGPREAMSQGCDDAYGFYECFVDESTYELRTPEVIDPVHRFPTVVIFHDAGSDGSDIVDDERLTEAFVENGFAVLAPNATKRKHLRFIYYGDKHEAQSALQGTYSRSTVEYSEKKFVMAGTDGGVRDQKYEEDTGWYYYNIDLAIYKGLVTEVDYIGRDEIAGLRDALGDAAENYQIDPDPVLIIGLGHGGSLVWQIACYAPTLSRILAPVGGAFWHNTPTNCRPGANLVHTHYRNSAFWPVNGVPGDKKRYARTSLTSNFKMLRSANRCDWYSESKRKDEIGMDHKIWPICQTDGSAKLMLLDEPFRFQQWWLDDMIARVEQTGIRRPFDEPQEPVPYGPEFSGPGEGSGFKAPDSGTGFQKPGGETGFQRSGTGTGFQRPGAGSGFRKSGGGTGFHKPGEETESPFKPAQ